MMNVVDLPIARKPEPDIIDALIAISKKIRIILGLRLAELRLMTGEDDVLLAMEGGEAMSVTQLSATMSVRFPTMLKAVDGLVERGFLDRVVGPVVRLSEQGHAVLFEITALRAKITADLSSSLGADRVGALAKDLVDLGDSLGEGLSRIG
jgi:DNA-binding MarR family transcriptional regulator